MQWSEAPTLQTETDGTMARELLLRQHVDRQDVALVVDLVRSAAKSYDMVVLDSVADGTPEMVLALGGDGTILAGARDARALDIPLLGINFGHMGFLAETSNFPMQEVLRRIKEDNYEVDPRMTLEIEVQRPGQDTARDWALNEAVVLHGDLAHPADLVFAIDGQDVSRYGADGIILATPTGSTAYSFSAGGPVVWPDTEAIVMAPLAAHGLFTRPLVVSPSSRLEVGVLADNRTPTQVWIDGSRVIDAPAGSVVTVTRGRRPVRLASLEHRPFAERLVQKFSLPTTGWRAPVLDGPRPDDGSRPGSAGTA